MRRASSLSALPTSSAGHGADAGAAGAPGVWKVNPSAASSLAACAASPGPPHAASVAAARPATASVGGAAAPPLPGAVHGGPSPVSHASAATITAPPASTPTAPPAARSIGGYGGGATAGAPGRPPAAPVAAVGGAGGGYGGGAAAPVRSVGAKGGYSKVQDSSTGGRLASRTGSCTNECIELGVACTTQLLLAARCSRGCVCKNRSHSIAWFHSS
jgi:hypothetical protein